MYIFCERKFHKKYDGDVYFWPKISFFEDTTKNTFFAIFLSNQATKNTKFKKSLLNWYFDSNHPFRCCVGSVLRFFLIFWVSCQIRSKIGKFGQKLNFFTLFGMKFKKWAKNRKNEPTQHLNGCFESKYQFKSDFQNVVFIVAWFERKVAKNVFFVIFSKNQIFGKNRQNQRVPGKNPFLKMYTFMNFNKFVEKL